MKITLAGYTRPSTLTDFPALVRLSTNITDFSYSQFKSDIGGDLRFSASDGTTELDYEIDTWDSGGNSYVWIEVPLLSGTTTDPPISFVKG